MQYVKSLINFPFLFVNCNNFTKVMSKLMSVIREEAKGKHTKCLQRVSLGYNTQWNFFPTFLHVFQVFHIIMIRKCTTISVLYH